MYWSLPHFQTKVAFTWTDDSQSEYIPENFPRKPGEFSSLERALLFNIQDDLVLLRAAFCKGASKKEDFIDYFKFNRKHYRDFPEETEKQVVQVLADFCKVGLIKASIDKTTGTPVIVYQPTRDLSVYIDGPLIQKINRERRQLSFDGASLQGRDLIHPLQIQNRLAVHTPHPQVPG